MPPIPLRKDYSKHEYMEIPDAGELKTKALSTGGFCFEKLNEFMEYFYLTLVTSVIRQTKVVSDKHRKQMIPFNAICQVSYHLTTFQVTFFANVNDI